MDEPEEAPGSTSPRVVGRGPGFVAPSAARQPARTRLQHASGRLRVRQGRRSPPSRARRHIPGGALTTGHLAGPALPKSNQLPRVTG